MNVKLLLFIINVKMIFLISWVKLKLMLPVFYFFNIAAGNFKFMDHIFVSNSAGIAQLLASVNNVIIYAN